jgi:nitrogen fixation/metabolism regulation signal transduction histidine kinase
MPVDSESQQKPQQDLRTIEALEAELETLASALPLAWLSVDRGLACVRRSARWAEMAGMARDSRGGLLRDAFPVAGPALAELAQSVLDSGAPILRHALPLPASGPGWQADCFPIQNRQAETIGAILTLQEVAGIVPAPLWGDFLGTLVHELRNFLSPILTSTQLLRRKGAERPDLLDSVTSGIERQTRRMNALLETLGTFSRLARGRLTPQLDLVALDAPLGQALAAIRPELEKCGLSQVVRVPSEPLVVIADHDRLAQAIERVLVHAAAFTPAGGHIDVDAFADGSDACIRIQDDGLGLDPGELARIFDPCGRQDLPLHGGPAGLGIDLPLAKGLVELQGGSLTVRSEGKGGGTEFVIRMPAA